MTVMKQQLFFKLNVNVYFNKGSPSSQRNSFNHSADPT